MGVCSSDLSPPPPSAPSAPSSIAPDKHIFAISGGGGPCLTHRDFIVDIVNNKQSSNGVMTPVIEGLISSSIKKSLEVVYIGTACLTLEKESGRAFEYMWKSGGTRGNDTVTCLQTVKATTRFSPSVLETADVVFVAEGSTYALLECWERTGLDIAIRRAWERGVVLAGCSAGACCWFSQAFSDSLPRELADPSGYTLLDCLGFLPFSFCPHYSGGRGALYRKQVTDGKMKVGYGVDDGAGLYFVNGKLKQVVVNVDTPDDKAVFLSGDDCLELKH